ncbi:MAG: LAGLIDADG family homing endonuclease [Candidatus Woesearchaeota archaeon]|jgi:intein/homing endonuclease|nr:LAGLIDADG family homing endonuclease [Candidatus Woesearchaeota archaeon]MDP7323746.1 LAGLIDADG family homing endonuclease [Candidatus Woesearchaeota archaeon]
MKFKIDLSKKDKLKGLELPDNPSPELAYLVGVLAGDGNIFVRKEKHDYRVKCVGDPKHERLFYDNVLKRAMYQVFNIMIDNKLQDSSKTYGFYIYSKALVTYLNQFGGLPIGKKYSKLRIPKWIGKKGFIPQFIRGLADTDFCLTYKKGNYPCIVGSSKSREFFQEVSVELKKLGFTFYEVYDSKQYDSRFKKGYSIINRIEINGWKNYCLWMHKVGFTNPRIIKKINAVVRNYGQ